MNCDQCQALRINSVYCHETGCPNTDSRYDRKSDTWVKQRTCFYCGCDCDANQTCCIDEGYSDDLDYEMDESE